ncbi:hypothetical protein GCM10012288_13700 [Malaciobacter pacificus]|uniref:Uncharacterized protein n=1 Tax=Malaciobacter pacificus TaxID=1080223 RepID=A0A5C2H7A9_9BACT|nr:hypothetical protein [Malaciobacter pacificus]QEP34850.1 hypothetical protein APAC_1762 [Malaciobacter pacificus]GGD40901.1 hypothetical protein GCM10012288_13700 [Malaciobacter pacificus]
MNKIVIKTNKKTKFSLYCPFTNEKLYNEDSSFEIYEGAGNYLFSICEDCLFFDAGNNDEIEKYWNDSALEAIEKFVENHKEENILVIEVQDGEDTYWFGFLNENNMELSSKEIEEKFIR